MVEAAPDFGPLDPWVDNLANLVQVMTGPNLTIDATLHELFTTFPARLGGTGWPDGALVVPSFPGWELLPRYTASVDAALKLVPRGWQGVVHLDEENHVGLFKLHDPRSHVSAEAFNLPLSIVLACLRAKNKEGAA